MISILMTSFNGERFIGEQIASLLAQTLQDFKLYIQDDKSTDNTFAIVEKYAEKHPDKIHAAQNTENSGCAKLNYIRMMIAHKNDYLMLCDQDDVWLPDKIEVTLAKMREMEAKYGAKTPLLVHTDLRVVDNELETISPSFKAAMNANYEKTKLHNQVIQNTLTGCTVMYNRVLAELITEAPTFMAMHDWWLMLIASAFGEIGSLDKQTILYRQHSENEIGAKDVRTLSYKINRVLNRAEIKEALSSTYAQAQGFLDVFNNSLSADQKKLLEAYIDIPNHYKLARIIIVFRLGVFKNGFSRKIAQIIFI